MAAQELRAVPKHCNSGDGTEAAGLQVESGAIVDLSVDHLVYQVHDLGCEFSHCRRGAGVALMSIVQGPEVRGRLT